MVAVVICPQVVQQFFNNEGAFNAGGALLTQVGGVNFATYSDSGGAVPLPNPIPLNSRGEVSTAVGASSQLFVVPNTVYQFTLFDANGNQLWSEPYINGVILTTVDSKLIVYDALPAESSVTIVNPQYPPLTIDRYGTNSVPGVTSMAAAFQSAITVAKQIGGTVFGGQTAPYLVDSPLDLTAAAGQQNLGFTIKISANVSAIALAGALAPSVIFKHNGHAFDCTGNTGLNFEGGSYGSDSTTYPKTFFFLARNTDENSQIVQLRGVRVLGKASISLYYNYGSENSLCDGCYFENNAPDNGTATRMYTANNIANQSSTFTAIATGSVSTTVHDAIGCSDYNAGGTATSDCVRLETVDGYHSFGGWAYNSSNTVNGRSLIYVDGTNSASNFCLIQGLKGETAAEKQSYGVYFNNFAVTHIGFTVDSCVLDCNVISIQSGALVVLDNFAMRGVTTTSGAGVNIPGTLQNSPSFDYGLELPVAIGTSINNCLTGDTSKLTITTRTDDSWIETGTVNRTFAPGIANGAENFTTVGAITQRGESAYNGNMVQFSIIFSAATSVAWTTGATITTLPGVATDKYACTVTDATAGTVQGSGVITAGSGNSTVTLTVAQTTSAHTFIISGSYFVA